MIEKILHRLEMVRRTGDHRWMARCPAHDDKSPSLSLAERNGRPLIHCFAGCEPLDILAAVGLEWADILPDDGRRVHRISPIKKVQDISVRRMKAQSILEAFATKAIEGRPATLVEIERAKACRDILRREQITAGWPF